MSSKNRGLGRWGLVLGLSASLVGVAVVVPGGTAILAAQKTQVKKKTMAGKKGAAKKTDDGMPKDEAAMPGDAAAAAAPAADGALSFKRDIAPILVANCIGCHSGTGAGLTRGKLDMTNFEKLMAGGKSGPDIVAGDPDSSHLILRIKGEESPKMPPANGQRGFSSEAAAKLEAWVKSGARLDAGIAKTEPLNKYAATVAPEQRDKIVEQAGRDRWKKASKDEPEVTVGSHFLLLSNKLPKARVDKLLKTMEAQFALTNRVLSTGRTPVLGAAEKIGIYVFKDNNAFVEFVRGVENQELEPGEQARAKLNVEAPYLVAVDPAGGAEEVAPSAPRKGARKGKKADDAPAGQTRTLAGLLTEQLVVAAANRAGKPPKWVAFGLGAFFAAQIEPGSPYYRGLRAETAENIRIGWQTKASEALGGEGKLESVRAVGFSLFEWMAANDSSKKSVPNFVQAMLEGQGKLDEAIGNCLNLDRESFLNLSGEWLVERYGRP